MPGVGRAVAIFFGALNLLDWLALVALFVAVVVGGALYLWRLF